mmetsp:Transcript_807/g.1738  ORF Transcript_807/g.1738 Transcript_807/m.1738 type:complete len:128 (-) Transcript_807:437-820(-)
MKLHAPLGNFRANKILVTAQFGGVHIEQPAFDESFTKNKQFVTISPLKKLPVLETAEGTISETNAITRFVARVGSSDLYNGSPAEWKITCVCLTAGIYRSYVSVRSIRRLSFACNSSECMPCSPSAL